MSGVPVPFLDLKRVSGAEPAEIEAAAVRVLRSGWYVLGRECAAFEREFAESLEVEHCVGTASGTDAIELALRALGIGRGDEVVTQANTCVPTISAIERTGALPVICDALLENGLMDPWSLKATVSPRTRAIVPVHLYGQCCDMSAIGRIASDGAIPVVEDCAQAHGAFHQSRAAGTIGTLGAFSFYPTKTLGALGDAGCVVTRDPALDGRLRSLRQYGERSRYETVESGVNSRLDELQAAILRVKLRSLAADVDRRRAIASTYRAALQGDLLQPLEASDPDSHGYHLFVCRTVDRQRTQDHFTAHSVATMIHYPRAIHQHPAYRQLGQERTLSAAEALAATVLSLPLFPGMTDAEVDAVIAAAT